MVPEPRARCLGTLLAVVRVGSLFFALFANPLRSSRLAFRFGNQDNTFPAAMECNKRKPSCPIRGSVTRYSEKLLGIL